MTFQMVAPGQRMMPQMGFNPYQTMDPVSLQQHMFYLAQMDPLSFQFYNQMPFMPMPGAPFMFPQPGFSQLPQQYYMQDAYMQ